MVPFHLVMLVEPFFLNRRWRCQPHPAASTELNPRSSLIQDAGRVASSVSSAMRLRFPTALTPRVRRGSLSLRWPISGNRHRMMSCSVVIRQWIVVVVMLKTSVMKRARSRAPMRRIGLQEHSSVERSATPETYSAVFVLHPGVPRSAQRQSNSPKSDSSPLATLEPLSSPATNHHPARSHTSLARSVTPSNSARLEGNPHRRGTRQPRWRR